MKAFLICAADAIEGEKPRTEGHPAPPMGWTMFVKCPPDLRFCDLIFPPA